MDMQTTALAVPAIGTYLEHEGGFFTGVLRVGDALLGVITAPKALGELTGAWLPSYTDVPGACSCFDSLANTRAMAEAGSAIAKQVLELNIAGHADWAIPARDVLELQYRHFKPTTDENSASFRDGDNPSSVPAGYPYSEQSPAQTSVEAVRARGDEALEPRWYLATKH